MMATMVRSTSHAADARGVTRRRGPRGLCKERGEPGHLCAKHESPGILRIWGAMAAKRPMKKTVSATGPCGRAVSPLGGTSLPPAGGRVGLYTWQSNT